MSRAGISAIEAIGRLDRITLDDEFARRTDIDLVGLSAFVASFSVPRNYTATQAEWGKITKVDVTNDRHALNYH